MRQQMSASDGRFKKENRNSANARARKEISRTYMEHARFEAV